MKKIILSILIAVTTLSFTLDTKGTRKSLTTNIDTSKIAIIPFDKSHFDIFDGNHIPTTLTNEDLMVIEDILIKSVDRYNSRRRKEGKKYFMIDKFHRDYKRQYIPVLNKSGEKQVYIYCFCSHSFDDKIDWKHKLLHIDDGGPCVFHLKINLKTKKIADIGINGVG